MEKVYALHKIAAKKEALDWGQFRSIGVTIEGQNLCHRNQECYPCGLKKWLKNHRYHARISANIRLRSWNPSFTALQFE